MSNPKNRPPSRPTPPVAPAPVAPPGADALKTQMPTGEVGVRHVPGPTLASDSGGSSKTEDTPRAAGYVADLTKTNEPPPGPPIAKSPEEFAGPESATIPPKPSDPTRPTGLGPNRPASAPPVDATTKKPGGKRPSHP
jgi:hypothetical protein